MIFCCFILIFKVLHLYIEISFLSFIFQLLLQILGQILTCFILFILKFQIFILSFIRSFCLFIFCLFFIIIFVSFSIHHLLLIVLFSWLLAFVYRLLFIIDFALIMESLHILTLLLYFLFYLLSLLTHLFRVLFVSSNSYYYLLMKILIFLYYLPFQKNCCYSNFPIILLSYLILFHLDLKIGWQFSYLNSYQLKICFYLYFISTDLTYLTDLMKPIFLYLYYSEQIFNLS